MTQERDVAQIKANAKRYYAQFLDVRDELLHLKSISAQQSICIKNISFAMKKLTRLLDEVSNDASSVRILLDEIQNHLERVKDDETDPANTKLLKKLIAQHIKLFRIIDDKISNLSELTYSIDSQPAASESIGRDDRVISGAQPLIQQNTPPIEETEDRNTRIERIIHKYDSVNDTIIDIISEHSIDLFIMDGPFTPISALNSYFIRGKLIFIIREPSEVINSEILDVIRNFEAQQDPVPSARPPITIILTQKQDGDLLIEQFSKSTIVEIVYIDFESGDIEMAQLLSNLLQGIFIHLSCNLDIVSAMYISDRIQMSPILTRAFEQFGINVIPVTYQKVV
jgi:hypothetical protein